MSEQPQDDGKVWGHIEEGVFRPLPKRPMLLAGLGPPPFDIRMVCGKVRHVIEQPPAEGSA